MNEINIWDEVNNALVRVKKALESLFGELEPYQRYELLHSQKKPRGSIRRKRRNRWKIDLS